MKTNKVPIMVLNRVEGIEPLPTANPFPDQPGTFRMIDPNEDLEEVGRQMVERLKNFLK